MQENDMSHISPSLERRRLKRLLFSLHVTTIDNTKPQTPHYTSPFQHPVIKSEDKRRDEAARSSKERNRAPPCYLFCQC
jgi:hypothetical protein